MIKIIRGKAIRIYSKISSIIKCNSLQAMGKIIKGYS